MSSLSRTILGLVVEIDRDVPRDFDLAKLAPTIETNS